jgi:hypothetical protein
VYLVRAAEEEMKKSLLLHKRGSLNNNRLRGSNKSSRKWSKMGQHLHRRRMKRNVAERGMRSSSLGSLYTGQRYRRIIAKLPLSRRKMKKLRLRNFSGKP